MAVQINIPADTHERHSPDVQHSELIRHYLTGQLVFLYSCVPVGKRRSRKLDVAAVSVV